MNIKFLIFLIAFFVPKISNYDFEGVALKSKTSQAFVLSNNILSRNFDEISCDNQLSLFSDALANREIWALRRKTLLTYSKCEKFILHDV